MKLIWVKRQDSIYQHHKTIEVGEVKCDVCKEDKDCIALDTSSNHDGGEKYSEYGSFKICETCVNQAFARPEGLKNSDPLVEED